MEKVGNVTHLSSGWRLSFQRPILVMPSSDVKAWLVVASRTRGHSDDHAAAVDGVLGLGFLLFFFLLFRGWSSISTQG